MRTSTAKWKWLVALLAASMIVFAIGCEEDDGPGVDPTPSNAPTLTMPANGSTVDLSDYITTDFVLEWDAVEGAVSYEVQIAATDGFSSSSILTDDTSEDNEYVVVQVNNFIIDGAHYWRARAVMDSAGTDFGDWASPFSFTPTAQPRTVTEVLAGDITANKTLSSGNTYLLRGGVFVTNGATLTIQPGVTIYGEAATDGMLVIAQGAKIMAEGTANDPIVFTSDRPDGSRGRGDWGGVIINGYADINTGDQAFGEGDTGPYGGDNDADNSGTMRYCRIEFAGREISPDNELNGLALQGVGSGTTIEYIQVHMNQDDGIEFFGGTVSAKHIYITGAADDSFDWTDGWRGKGQFWVAQQYADDANRGMEADNSGDNNTAMPYSEPTIYNFTLVGATAGDRGMLLREGTKGKFYNGIVMNFTDYSFRIDGDVSATNFDNGDLFLMNSILNSTENYHDDAASMAAVTGEAFMNDEADPQLTAPLNVNAPDYTPVADGLAATKEAAQPTDAWFDAVDFIGGVDPDNNWLAGWTTAEQN